MTPEAVIDRYLETAGREPCDPAELALLLGTDADLLSRWLLLLSCPAEPAAFIDAVSRLSPERFHDLATSQALAVLTVSGSVRLSFDQWQSVLNASLVGELLAVELGLPNPVAMRWRVLLAASGVNLPEDPLLTELLAFRGARPELLEDASAMHRLFAVVEALDVSDPLVSQDAAQSLLGIGPQRYQSILATAEARCAELVERLGLPPREDFDYAERLWLRLQISMLGRLFPLRGSDAAFLDVHTLVARRLFGSVPELFLLDDQRLRLLRIGGGGPDIALSSRSSTVARSAREGEQLELIERVDQAVADRQVLRHLGKNDGVCVPLVDARQQALGVLVFAVDEDVDLEAAMSLYAAELARRVCARSSRTVPDGELLTRYQQSAEKRLREIVHEANNPLSVVNNYLHILQLKLEHEPEAVEQLRLIGEELKRVRDIISQVRNVPHAEMAAEPGVALAKVDLEQLVTRLVELHLGYAGEFDVALTSTVSGQGLELRTDEQRLIQVLTNLLRNAIEAAGGATVSVGVEAGVFREGREGAVLRVTDTGPGLPQAVRERLMEPKESTKGGDHSGLGLHIVYRLVQELDGSLDLHTTSAGSVFTVFLPLDPATSPGA